MAWALGSSVTAETGSSPAVLPPMLRRRVTPLGQMAFRTACKLSVPERARFIFCSRHGEFQRTLGILTALATGAAVSPAEFSLSVHNALAGLLSIAWRNTAGHTTIAAGADSFRSALIEAASCLMEYPEEPVLLVYCDDRLPQPYDELADSDETGFAIAMLLTSPRHDFNDVILELTPRNAAAESASGQALAFLRFLLSDRNEERSDNEHLRWRWRNA
ncbi:MAG: beta-ketoacyl synthase chain length factor [Candidatus Binataceae bacterium]|nr:beta-ketoacyl synthase chain length factor [Candidatus Binataceae bacterium]